MSDYQFPVSLALRLDWSELDIYGHINNVAFFKYLQASRVNYWEQIGMNSLSADMGIGPLLASTKCDFKKPLFYPGNIAVYASVTNMQRTSFSLYHQIHDVAGNIVAEGFDIVVLFNYKENKKETIPGDLRSIIEELEQRSFPSQ